MYDDDGDDLTLEEIVKRLKRLAQEEERDGETAHKIADRMEQRGSLIWILLAELYERGYLTSMPGAGRPRRPKGPGNGKDNGTGRRPRGPVVEHDAQRGVKRVRVEPLMNGAALVTIDDRRVRLPRGMVRLFEVLCEDKGRSRDHLVDWKSVDHIRQRLGTKDKPAAYTTLTTNISRLRDCLHDAGVNWMYVQQDDELGYRFAVAKRRVTGRALR